MTGKNNSKNISNIIKTPTTGGAKLNVDKYIKKK